MKTSVSESFDHAAEDYDREFTHTGIGVLQRQRVYHWLTRVGWFEQPGELLEVNCGTGEDAQEMASRGFAVRATDLSPKMVELTKRKTPDQVLVEVADMSTAVQRYGSQTQFILSNFGGLNCLSPSELSEFCQASGDAQHTGGKVALVVMPKFCLMESAYFFVTGRWSKIWRRRTSGAVDVQVGGNLVSTWYHRPGTLKKSLRAAGYRIDLCKPVALFLPPSYMSNRLKAGSFGLKILHTFEKMLGAVSWFSGAADHFIIVATKK